MTINGRRIALTGMVGVIALWAVGAAAAAVTERVSVATDGQQGNDMSGRFAGPAISADGLVVAFDSIANTLVPSDTNGDADVFVRDRTTGATERVSIRSNGGQANDDSTRPSIDATVHRVPRQLSGHLRPRRDRVTGLGFSRGLRYGLLVASNDPRLHR